jgi:hypothetical protein
MFTPSLALFFGTNAPTKNLNFYYKRNILYINAFLGLIFGVLVLQLNVWGKDMQGHSYLRRNPIFSCKDPNSDWTQWEFSTPHGQCIK